MPKGPKGEKRPRDVSQLGKTIVDIAMGEAVAVRLGRVMLSRAPLSGRP